MIVSVGLPTCMEGMMYPVPFATVDEVIEIAKLAETLGYDSVWGNDHMTTQRYVRAEYATPPNYWEPLIMYAYIAAETTTLRMGTGILVIPMRQDIVVVAKQIATLDHLSKGRLSLGVGVGAYREEFEALAPHTSAHRGDMLEEGVQALQHLFSERVASWQGTYYHFHDVEMYPKPVQNPVPLYFGGNNPNAVRRAATYGTGWMPAALPPNQFRERLDTLQRIASEKQRDDIEFDIAPQLITYIGKTHEEALTHFHASQIYKHLASLKKSTLKGQTEETFADTNLIGTADEIVEKIKKLETVGVTHLCGLYFAANSISELQEQMQIFAEDVLPRINI